MTTVAARRWSREEYHRATELGLFGPEERLELIDGEIVQHMSAKLRPHAIGVAHSRNALSRAFGSGYHVQQEHPIVLPGESEPEPDLVVLAGIPGDYIEHPNTPDALLVVEVADSSLRYDTVQKASLYARGGIRDYWVLNLSDRLLEVFREPVVDPGARYGFSYRQRIRLAESESIAPLAAPEVLISVREMLPGVFGS